jgi:hypothetical protein
MNTLHAFGDDNASFYIFLLHPSSLSGNQSSMKTANKFACASKLCCKAGCLGVCPNMHNNEEQIARNGLQQHFHNRYQFFQLELTDHVLLKVWKALTFITAHSAWGTKNEATAS